MPSVFEDHFRTEIARFCHLIYEKNYVASTDGNVSARLPDGHIMCTPTISNKGFIKPEDMVIIDMKGQRIRGERKSSSEIAMHLLIYEMRPDIHAVVHAHPPCATAYAAAGIPLNKALISEVVLALDVAYHRYGANANLLGAAAIQDEVVLNGAGVATAKDMAAQHAVPHMSWGSVEFRDGFDRDEAGKTFEPFGDVQTQLGSAGN